MRQRQMSHAELQQVRCRAGRRLQWRVYDARGMDARRRMYAAAPLPLRRRHFRIQDFTRLPRHAVAAISVERPFQIAHGITVCVEAHCVCVITPPSPRLHHL